MEQAIHDQVYQLTLEALEDHSNVYKNASASEKMQNTNMYNAYAQYNYKT